MRTQVRNKILFGDLGDIKDIDGLKADGISVVLIVARELDAPADTKDVRYIKIGLENGFNPPHVRDIACHTTKYFSEFGEKVLVVSAEGLSRAVYVVARAVCEQENRPIYEVFQEITKLKPSIKFIPGLYM